jgi:hypothetical protein
MTAADVSSHEDSIAKIVIAINSFFRYISDLPDTLFFNSIQPANFLKKFLLKTDSRKKRRIN